MSKKNSSDTIGNRTRDLYSNALNQLQHRVPPQIKKDTISNYYIRNFTRECNELIALLSKQGILVGITANGQCYLTL